jgi:hypothetical protein
MTVSNGSLDPYPSTKPITDFVVGALIALLTISVPFIIILEPTKYHDTQARSQRQVSTVRS